MNAKPTIRTYIRGRVAHSELAGPQDSGPFVTISREPGAGGLALAEALLDELDQRADQTRFSDWRIFDEPALEKIAANPALRQSLSRCLGESSQARLVDGLRESLKGDIPGDYLVSGLFFAVRATAALGKAIILGRGGACLTRDLPGGLHVRLVAPQDVRIEALARGNNCSRAEAIRRMRQLEQRRAAFVRDYFGRRVDDPLLYDCVWNTGTLPHKEIARRLVELIAYSSQRAASSA